MNFGPDETPLDQSLREVFHDYHLPPAEHPDVWNGLAQQLATQAAPRTNAGLSYRLVLPLTAALGVGIAVGWLLPRPAATPAVRHTVASQPAAVAKPLAAGFDTPDKSLKSNTSTIEVSAVPTAVLAHSVARPARRHAASVRPATSQPSVQETPAEAPMLAAATLDSAVERQPLATALDSNLLPVATAGNTDSVAAKTPRGKEPEESVILYHKATHRLSERGIVIRRWFAHLGKSMRHLLGKH